MSLTFNKNLTPEELAELAADCERSKNQERERRMREGGYIPVISKDHLEIPDDMTYYTGCMLTQPILIFKTEIIDRLAKEEDASRRLEHFRKQCEFKKNEAALNIDMHRY